MSYTNRWHAAVKILRKAKISDVKLDHHGLIDSKVECRSMMLTTFDINEIIRDR